MSVGTPAMTSPRHDEQGPQMPDITAQGAPRSLLTFLREGRAQAAPAVREPRAKLWTSRRLVALAIALLIPIIAIGGFAASAAQAADDDEMMKYSFYKAASATTSFFSAVQQPGSTDGFSQSWQSTLADPGSAGSLLGYADPNFSDVQGWINSKLSGSSDAIGYDALLMRDGEDASKTLAPKFQGMVDYAYFGAALNGMGLDSTGSGLGLPMVNWLSGGTILLLFVMGGAVDFLFNAIVSVLGMLNPFKLFYLGVSALSPTLADGMIGNGDDYVGPLDGLVEWIGGWYQALTSLAWGVMVPLFIAVLLFGLLLFKKMDRGGAVKKLFVRMLFIGLGLPLLGTMYTGMIDSMADASSEGNAGSARVVMSTYVDFEGWAENSRLAVPAGATIAWNASTSSPTGPALANVRNTALAINNQTLSLGLTAIVGNNSFDGTWAAKVMEGQKADTASPAATYTKVIEMLQRFQSGDKYTAATFENDVKGGVPQTDFFTKDDGAGVEEWFKNLNDPAQINKADPSTNPVISVSQGTGLRASGSQSDRKFTSNIRSCTYTGQNLIIGNEGAPRACNLSPLAMYNYLNTDFGPNSMTMYSSSNVASEATRAIHNSVSAVGTGTMSFLYWLNAVVLLGSFVLIGIGYAFSMLFASIKRSIQVVGAVPFASLGAIAAIAKVIVCSIALTLEVLVTIFLYKLVQEFLTSLPQIIEIPFAGFLNGGKSGENSGFVAFLVGGWGFAMVITVASIIGIIAFTVLAVRLRKSFVKAIEEAVTKLVEKFVDSQVGIPSPGALAPALAGGIASGAGAAAATKMMNKNGKGAVSATSGDPKQVRPEGVTTAGGVGQTATADQPMKGQLEITSGADGNGDPGPPESPRPAGGPQEINVSEEVNIGRDVQQNGLSSRSERGDAPRTPQVGDDALSSASHSMEDTAQGYKNAKNIRREAQEKGGQAAISAGETAARVFAGDARGAVEAGGRTVEHGGSAVASGEEAKAHKKDAGRSSLDKPDTRHQKNADRARTVSRAGGAAAQTASVAGASAGGGTPTSAPKGGGVAPKQTARPAAPPPRAPQGSSRPAGTQPTPSRSPQPPVRASQAPAPRAVAAPKAPKPATQPPRSSTGGASPTPSQGASKTVHAPRTTARPNRTPKASS